MAGFDGKQERLLADQPRGEPSEAAVAEHAGRQERYLSASRLLESTADGEGVTYLKAGLEREVAGQRAQAAGATGGSGSAKASYSPQGVAEPTPTAERWLSTAPRGGGAGAERSAVVTAARGTRFLPGSARAQGQVCMECGKDATRRESVPDREFAREGGVGDDGQSAFGHVLRAGRAYPFTEPAMTSVGKVSRQARQGFGPRGVIGRRPSRSAPLPSATNSEPWVQMRTSAFLADSLQVAIERGWVSAA